MYLHSVMLKCIMALLLSCIRKRDKSAAIAEKRKSVLHTFCFLALFQRIFIVQLENEKAVCVLFYTQILKC